MIWSSISTSACDHKQGIPKTYLIHTFARPIPSCTHSQGSRQFCYTASEDGTEKPHTRK